MSFKSSEATLKTRTFKDLISTMPPGLRATLIAFMQFGHVFASTIPNLEVSHFIYGQN
jgi:hypothetical protein